MIKLTNPKGQPVWVNPDRIYMIQPQRHEGEPTGMTSIQIPGRRVTVKESPELVAKLWAES